MTFGRLLAAMVTPFDADQKIAPVATQRLIEHLIAQQNDGVIVAGTTGESSTLTDAEKLSLFDVAVQAANGRIKVIASTGTNDTQHTVDLSIQAEQCGVDGLMLVAPYYSRPSQDGLIRHFLAVADQVKIPIMLYNIPSRTGVNLTAETVRVLAQHPRIVAIKESSGDLEQMTYIRAQAPQLTLYSGDDSLTLPVLSIGGHGVVSVTSHLVGTQMKAMIQAYIEGKPQQASAWHTTLMPMFQGMFACPHRVPNPVPIKYALRKMGLDCGTVRLPLVEVTAEEAMFIDALLTAFSTKEVVQNL
jgi:4-hydroxy-tetrahydrodipicolinate synthase